MNPPGTTREFAKSSLGHLAQGSPLLSDDPLLLLSATIDVRGIAFMQRSNPKVRLDDYKKALHLWLADPAVRHIAFCENSGSNLEELREIEQRSNLLHKDIHFISYNAPDFPRHLGKGYGDMLNLKQFVITFPGISDTTKVIRTSGRYYIRNVDKLIDYVKAHNQFDVICDLEKNLAWADCRVFSASVAFLKEYLFPMHELINDTAGLYFEHVLARAVHRALADGRGWSLPACVPDIVGVSGTSGYEYGTSKMRTVAKRYLYTVKRIVFRR